MRTYIYLTLIFISSFFCIKKNTDTPCAINMEVLQKDLATYTVWNKKVVANYAAQPEIVAEAKRRFDIAYPLLNNWLRDFSNFAPKFDSNPMDALTPPTQYRLHTNRALPDINAYTSYVDSLVNPEDFEPSPENDVIGQVAKQSHWEFNMLSSKHESSLANCMRGLNEADITKIRQKIRAIKLDKFPGE